MNPHPSQPKLRAAILLAAICVTLPAFTQTPPPEGPRRNPDPAPFQGGPEFGGQPPPGAEGFGPGGFGPGGPGGFGGRGGVRQDLKLVKEFDKNGNNRLEADERKAARTSLSERGTGRGPGGRGGRRGGFGPGGRGEDLGPAEPGRKLTVADVKTYSNEPAYDSLTLRTFFLEFENADWEKELADFNNTDVEVPVKLTVDGKTYNDVGVHFRGQSSFMMVPEGRKRSLNLAMDFVHKDQALGGYHTFNLLNAHGDPTFIRTVLFFDIARAFIPAPKANFVRVVINGENWGIYPSAQQFNKEFVKDWFGTTKGARWKVPGSPGGRGGLEYLGDNVADYKRVYEIKTKDDEASWNSFIRLCKVLNETPPAELEAALDPILDINGALKFLAIENALINNDGYWVRASDYSIYLDEKGRFHVIPHDANETFLAAGGPGFGGGRRGGRGGRGGPGGFEGGFPNREGGPGPGENRGGFDPEGAGLPGGPGGPGPGEFGRRGGPGGGPGGGGVEIDPLMAANDPGKPLISKLLAVPALRARYLGYVRQIAEEWLDWNKLGPIAERYHQLIAEDIKIDTRKLVSTEAFLQGLADEGQPAGEIGARGGAGPGRRTISLKSFVERRRAYLLNHAEVKNAKF